MSTVIPASAKSLWTGRVISALMVLFLIFDGVTKVLKLAPVQEASARLGYARSLTVWIGITVLACTVIYVIPRTSILGAILLTGYLGGAVASQVRIGAPIFDTSFPLIFGVLIWGGLYLRDQRLRSLIPLHG
jgi:hypothetical protein